MPPDEPIAPPTGQRRCPVCWTWFTPNHPSNPHPRRYCCGACRIEDSRRRRERQQIQTLIDAKLEAIRAVTAAGADRRDATRLRQELAKERHP
jgi:hypothetical protein